jgi:hypothetical protein
MRQGTTGMGIETPVPGCLVQSGTLSHGRIAIAAYWEHGFSSHWLNVFFFGYNIFRYI